MYVQGVLLNNNHFSKRLHTLDSNW